MAYDRHPHAWAFIDSPPLSFTSSYLWDGDDSGNVDGGLFIDAFLLCITIHCNHQTHAHHLNAVNNMLYNVGSMLIDST
jgi:hypothetical protein